MPALFVFLIKVNVALLLFCLGYYLVLRHLTFYTLNRVYLIVAILFSTFYSKIDLSDFFQRHQEIAQPVQVVVLNWQRPVEAAVKPINNWYWVEMAFWLGVVLLAARFAVQLYSLYRLHQRSTLIKLNQYTVRTIKGNVNPFSFWRSIYINPANHEHNDLEAILEHEQIHVNQWHTLDIILGELSTIFYWFNPGVWLMKKAIRENIEFITDRKILQNGVDSKSYQYSLLHVNFGSTSNAIVNHFNISTIKKRIIMMNTKASSKLNLTRYALLLPIVVVLLLVFTVSKAALTKDLAKNSDRVLKSIQKAVTKIGNTSTVKAIINQISIKPSEALSSGKKVAVTGHDTVIIKNIEINKSAIDTPKKVTFSKLTIIPTSPNPDSTIYVVDGKVMQSFKLNSISPDDIYSIDISKPTTSAFKGGAIIVITTKRNTHPAIRVIGKAYTLGVVQGVNNSYSLTTTDSIRKIKVNGTYLADSTIAKLSKKKGTAIYSANAVFVNGTGQAVYADSALREVLVTGRASKNTAVATAGSRNGNIYVDHISDKLIVIDGKVANEKALKKVSANDIESMSVISGKAATALYGDDAAKGVVVITTKKAKKE